MRTVEVRTTARRVSVLVPVAVTLLWGAFVVLMVSQGAFPTGLLPFAPLLVGALVMLYWQSLAPRSIVLHPDGRIDVVGGRFAEPPLHVRDLEVVRLDRTWAERMGGSATGLTLRFASTDVRLPGPVEGVMDFVTAARAQQDADPQARRLVVAGL